MLHFPQFGKTCLSQNETKHWTFFFFFACLALCFVPFCFAFDSRCLGKWKTSGFCSSSTFLWYLLSNLLQLWGGDSPQWARLDRAHRGDHPSPCGFSWFDSRHFREVEGEWQPLVLHFPAALAIKGGFSYQGGFLDWAHWGEPPPLNSGRLRGAKDKWQSHLISATPPPHRNRQKLWALSPMSMEGDDFHAQWGEGLWFGQQAPQRENR